MLAIGTKAPDFTLPDKDGNPVTLSSFLGKKVVLYFYAKDNTAGCNRQAQGYAALFQEFAARGVVVIGISKDTPKSHANFAQKFELPFILLSDEDKTVLQQYDVWKEKKLYGKVSFGTVRSSCIIDENGVIIGAFEKVKPDDNAQRMLAELDKA